MKIWYTTLCKGCTIGLCKEAFSMESIKEYAKRNNVSYEAVRRQVERYKSDLEGHVSVVGRTRYLDEYATDFLDRKRSTNPVVIIQADKDDLIEQLKREKEQLLIKVAEQADRIAGLNEWKAGTVEQLAEARYNQLCLEEKTAEADKRREELDSAKREIANLAQQLDVEKSRSWLDKLLKK